MRTSSANLAIVDEARAIWAEIGATPAQSARLAADARRRHLLQSREPAPAYAENTAADKFELSPDQVDRLENLTPAAGVRHDEANMSAIDQ